MAEEMLMVTSNDCSIEVIPENDNGEYFSLDSTAQKPGDPFEHRKDIIEMKKVISSLKEKLTFGNQDIIEEELDQLKPRKNFDSLFDEELNKIVMASKGLEQKDPGLHKAVEYVVESCHDLKKIANEKDASLKRPMEILEEVLPTLLSTCQLESVELSGRPLEAMEKYEKSRSEMKLCESDFDMDGRLAKKEESLAFIEEAVIASREDREMLEAVIQSERDQNRLGRILETKENVSLLISSESRDLHKKHDACTKDLKEIVNAQEEQQKRMKEATTSYETRTKSAELKVKILEKRQAELEKQLADVIKEKEKVRNNIVFENAIQNRAVELHEIVLTSLSELHAKISSVALRVEALSNITKVVNAFSKTLFDGATNAQKSYEDHLKKLEIQALSQQRDVLVSSLVDNMIEIDDVNENIEDYESRMKQLRHDMTLAARRGQNAIVKKSKEDMSLFEDEVNTQKALLESLDEKLRELRDSTTEVDERLAGRGIVLASVIDLYNQRKRNKGRLPGLDSMLSLECCP